MSDFIFYNFTRVMLSFLMQVGACLEPMGKVRPLFGQAFFCFDFHSYVKFFYSLP